MTSGGLDPAREPLVVRPRKRLSITIHDHPARDSSARKLNFGLANHPAIGPPILSSLLHHPGLIAKLFAANGFRRRSYDDQDGDNDINIILQPSDLQDIEKRSKPKSPDISINNDRYHHHQQAGRATIDVSASTTETDTINSNNNNNSYRNNNYHNSRKNLTLSNDLKLAKSLLDQDYNLTVQLFIRKSALNWNFNSFSFDALSCGRSLTELLLHLFDYYDLYNVFELDMVNVMKCFRLLEFGYHSTNPYHNSIHAADVTQAMHCFIQEKKIRKHMTHLETLCSIMAAVCHDLDHPGVNQPFLVATNNPLASLYNNSSVLENHHWRFALCIFKESEIFDHFEAPVLDEMKLQLKHLILATDIARQNDYLRRFKAMTESREFSMSNTDDRALVLQMALKCADLGNPCRPWLISRVWSNLICDEFYKMGGVEKRLGIPLTPICQRDKTSIASIQTDFFRFIVLPLLDLWHKFLRSPLSDLLMSNFDHNYQRWQKASRVGQQLRRPKSIASLVLVAGDAENAADDHDEPCVCSRGAAARKCRPGRSGAHHSRPSYGAIKRATSDYVKSGSGSLERLRNFQFDRMVSRSPILAGTRQQPPLVKADAARTAGSMQQSQSMQPTSSGPGAAATKVPTAPAEVRHTPRPPHKKQTHSQDKHAEGGCGSGGGGCCGGGGGGGGLGKKAEQTSSEQLHHKSRCSAPPSSAAASLGCTTSVPRKALSPIEDGDAPSPDQQQHQQQQQGSQRQSKYCGKSRPTNTPKPSAFPPSSQSGNSSPSSSSSVSRASSACSSPVIQRSMSLRTSIDQLVGSSAVHLHHVKHQQHQQHHQHHHHQHQHHHQRLIQNNPFLAQHYETTSSAARRTNLAPARQSTPLSASQAKNLYAGRRRESDPGCCTDNYEIAAAIVLLQYQKNSFIHQRRSSLPVCVPKRRSSK